MIDKGTVGHLSGLIYALFFGAIFSALALHIFPHFHPALKCLIIGAFVFFFYFVGEWVAVRQELNKKIPTPSHELRRRKKEFFDRLDSRGRR